MATSNASITRRDVLKGGALAAAGLAGMAAMGKAAVADEAPWDYETDVVICGCGSASTPAAIEAHDNGAEVIIIEKKDWCGGQMRRNVGAIAAGGTQVQKYLGVEDSAEDFYEFWKARAGVAGDPELGKIMCEQAPSVIDWIIDDLGGQPLEEWDFSGGEMGLEEASYDPGLNNGSVISGDPKEFFTQYGFTPVARTHIFKANDDDPFIGDPEKFIMMPGGTGLWKVCSNALAERGIEPMTETELTSLVVTPDTSEVCGVVAKQGDAEIRIKARKAVFIGTGNYASNHEMLNNYTGKDFEPNDFGGNVLDLAGDNDGSGIRAAQQVGAQLYRPYNEAGDGAGSFMYEGLKINTEANVIDVDGNPIPRLYAGGLASGGFIGDAYTVCGIMMTRCFTFGRIAGRAMAALEPLA